MRTADSRLTDRVAALMRARGWHKVTVTALMGQLGTDVTGIGADGRRWLLRCHGDPDRVTPMDVQRFAGTARDFQRSDVTMLVVDGPATTPLLHAAAQARITLVDAASLSWWTALQAR